MAPTIFDDCKHLVDKQKVSGLSVPKFCRQHNLPHKYFYSRKSIISCIALNNLAIKQAKIRHQFITPLEYKA